jgi:hypothetical protein
MLLADRRHTTGSNDPDQIALPQSALFHESVQGVERFRVPDFAATFEALDQDSQ